MDALVAFGDHRAHAQQQRAFRRPVARRTRAVFLARQHDQRHAFFLVFHRRVVDVIFSPSGLVQRPAAFGAGRELIAQANIRERAAHHHFVIAAPRAVGIEVRPACTPLAISHTFPRAIGGNRAGGRDVIGRDAIAENRQHARVANIGERGGVFGMLSKNGGFLM
jgi:hypothetical protein